jgi:hypothetical protein
MRSKAFNPSLHSQHDQVARNAGLYHLAGQAGVTEISENENKYGVDLIYFEGEKAKTLEVEVKLTWPGGPFPFDTINVLGRKVKYFKDGAQLLLLAKNHQDYLILQPADILRQAPVEINNKYVFEAEPFIQVPVHLADFYRFTSKVDSSPIECKCGCRNFSVANSRLICLNCEKRI